jgi:AraC-like DNA-binding protein
MTGRRANWPSLVWPDAPAPKVVERSPHGTLASLLAALDEVRALDDADAVLRRAVELARDRIGLKRVGIFLLDPSRNLMLGTWGMDIASAVVDEHHVIYDLCASDREALRRAEGQGAPFTVFDNCPIIEHQGGETRVAGRGWVAKTPIRSKLGAIGMMFNDAGLTGAPIDEAKQTHAAILCSMLGTVLDPVRGWIGRRPTHLSESPGESMVSATIEMLHRDPAVGGKEIAAALEVRHSRLFRTFKTRMGMSLVDYRNRLRLDRFAGLVDRGCTNLLEAALEAGFGSYAQFYRVFRAQVHASPRDYLTPLGVERRLPSACLSVGSTRRGESRRR